MKTSKIVTIILLFISLFFISSISTAYSNSKFSIDIPNTFQKTSEMPNLAFKNSQGNGIGILIQDTSNYKDLKFNKKNLNTFTYALSEVFKSNYGENIIIQTKEIIKATKNQYKCFHVIFKFSSYYIEYYFFVTNEYAYMLALTSNNSSYLNSTIAEKVVDSFTINNYKEMVTGSSIWEKMLIAAASAGIIGIIYYLFNHRKKDNKTVNLEEYRIQNEIQEKTSKEEVISPIEGGKLKMEKFEEIIIKGVYVIYIISLIAFNVLAVIIYVYTIYYFAVHNGFWGAFISLCTPVLSSIYLFFHLIPIEGFFNDFTMLCIYFIISFIYSFSERKIRK